MCTLKWVPAHRTTLQLPCMSHVLHVTCLYVCVFVSGILYAFFQLSFSCLTCHSIFSWPLPLLQHASAVSLAMSLGQLPYCLHCSVTCHEPLYVLMGNMQWALNEI